jgi:hypothetical protein
MANGWSGIIGFLSDQQWFLVTIRGLRAPTVP